jgi:predicted outer membrane repeat protein
MPQPPPPSYAADLCRQPAVVTSVVASSDQLYAAVRTQSVQCIRLEPGTYVLDKATYPPWEVAGLWLNRSVSLVANVDGTRAVLNASRGKCDFSGSPSQPLVVAGGGPPWRPDPSATPSSVYVSGLEFTGGCKLGGAGVWVDVGARLTMHNVSVSGNNASSQGGGIYVDHNSTLELYDAEVYANNAGSWSGGSGLYIQGDATLVNAQIHHNGANPWWAYWNRPSGGPGGGMTIVGNYNVDIWNSEIRENRALPNFFLAGSGGGISINGYDSNYCMRASGCHVRIFGSRIVNNTANCTGGGVYVAGGNYGEPQSLQVSDTLIEGNVAWDDAGGIHHGGYGPLLTLTRSTVRYNIAQRWGGGGLHVLGNATLNATDVYGNSATQAAYAQGGGITNEGNLTLIDSAIFDNSNGGGIPNASQDLWIWSRGTVNVIATVDPVPAKPAYSMSIRRAP